MPQAQTTGPPRGGLTPPAPLPTGTRRTLFTLALALAALAGNYFSLPVSYGVDFVFGSIAVLLALAWLGTGPGLVVALIGGAYTWLLWGHPYALMIFTAEAAAVGWQRERARRHGLTPPPLAVPVTLFWVLLGIPLVLLSHGTILGMDWTTTVLIAAKQASNGILNAALAGLILIAVTVLTRRPSVLPLGQVLFAVLLAGMLLPSLLVHAWENRDLKERREAAQASRLRLFGELATHQLLAHTAGGEQSPSTMETELQVMRAALTENLTAASDPQLRLEPGPAQVPEAAADRSGVLGRQPQPGQTIPTSVPGLSLIMPEGRHSSRAAMWRQARYRMEIPAHTQPVAGFAAGPATQVALPVWHLVLEFSAAPLVNQVQVTAAELLSALLAIALFGVLLADRLTRRIVAPLSRLLETTRTLPAAIREDRPWQAPEPSLLAETSQLAKAVAEMAGSLAATFRSLRDERDEREVLIEALSQAGIGLSIARRSGDDFLLTYVNRGLETLTGYGAAECLGTNCRFLQGTDLDQPGLHEMRLAIAAGQPVRVVLRNYHKDGRRLWNSVNLVPMRGTDGTVTQFVGVQQDVTNAIEILERLRRSESRLAEAQALGRMGSWYLDVHTGEVEWSDQGYRLLGYAPGEVAATRRNLLRRIHRDDRRWVTLELLGLLSGKPMAVEHQVRLALPGGTTRVVLTRNRVHRDPQGRVIAVDGVSIDITERKAAEQALAEGEQRFRNLFETMAEGVIYRDADGAITAANPAALRLIGRPLDELLGRGLQDLPWQIVGEDGSPFPATEHPTLAALRTGRDPGEIVMGVVNPLLDDINWLLVHAQPEFRPGETRPYRVFTTLADITRLKKTEQRLAAIIESSPHGIVEADPATGRLIWCNGSMLRLFGYTAAQWEGLTADDLHPVEALPQVHAHFARIASRDLSAVLDLPCRRRNGSVFYSKVSPGLIRLGQTSTVIAFFTDVSEEHLGRLALEHSREALLKAQELSMVGSWELDIVAAELTWSPQVYRIYQREPGVFTPSYEDLLAAIHPEDRPRVERAYWDSLANRAPYDLVHRLLLPDGRVNWVHDRCESEFGQDGAPLRSRGTIQDITERRVAEEQLKESEQRLAAVFDNAPIGIALMGPDLRIERVNRAMAVLLGRTEAELAGTRVDTVTHPDDWDRDVAQYLELTAGRRDSYRMTKRYLRPDGSMVWGDLRVTLLPSRPGEAPIPMGMVEDITELHAQTEQRQALELALARYTTQLEELVDLINQPRPAAEQLGALLRLGRQGLGKTAAVLGVVDEAHGHRVLVSVRDDDWTGVTPRVSRSLLAEALASRGEPFLLGPERLPGAAVAAGFGSCLLVAFDGGHPDGKIDTLVLSLWGLTRTNALMGPERQIIRLIAQRISSLRYQEQSQLDLIAARERETIGHLASGVAHDFNNLLGVIDANIYYLNASLGDLGLIDPDIRQVLEETQSALGQAKVVTSGMLSLSRAGGVPLEPMDLGAPVAELERILRQVLPPSIALRVGVPSGLRVQSNGAFLQSALLNLAFNARDAMRDGGILTIEASPMRWDGRSACLRIGHLPPGDCVEVTVSDTGSGITPANLARIFDPLFSTKARQRGHGLGLFMVQEFVTRSGAGLTVDSEVNAGTRFRLLLPQATTAAPADRPQEPHHGTGEPHLLSTRQAPAGDAAAPAPLADLRMLVVDDDPRVRDAVTRLLALDGARHAQAETGQACLDLLERDGAFDLVLSDIAMPVLDGIELHRRLAEERPTLPVILMTGQAAAITALEGLSESPTVLRKPLDPQTLRTTILARTGARPEPEASVSGERQVVATRDAPRR